MVNYLSRRVNPTPYVNFMPPELAAFGEQPMRARLHMLAPPPVANRDHANYPEGRQGRRPLALSRLERFTRLPHDFLKLVFF